jgi:glycosyltransferase involved in cell wall biosynthesis
MKILHLTPSLPWPPDSGGKICAWNHIQADSRFADTGLISFSEAAADAISLGALNSVCRRVEIVRRPRNLDGVMGGARSLLSNMAMNIAKYRWPEFTRAVSRVVTEWSPDIVVAHHLHMASYLLELKGPVTILREHNIDSDLMARYAQTLRNPAMAAFAWRQAEQIRELEMRVAPRVNRCVVITHDDRQMLKKLAPTASIDVLPGVIDPERYTPIDPPNGTDPLIVSTGSFNFRPTGEGLVDFVDHAWPRILKASPRARFRIVGACPDKLARRIAGPGIEVLGRVDQVRAQLKGAHVFIVPLRVGSGMRMRILESLAWQIPTVSTPIGCKGISVEDGRHLLVAESPSDMASAVLSLLRDKVTAQTLRREGRRLVENHYSLATSEQITSRIYGRFHDRAVVDQNAS